MQTHRLRAIAASPPRRRGGWAGAVAPSFVLFMYACSSSPAASAPDASSSQEASAGTPDASAGGDAGDGGPDCSNKPQTGDFPADVSAVLAAKCQTCHSNPPINHAPFPLLTYADTLKPDTVTPYAGQPIWRVMDIVIQPNAMPHMPFGNAPPLTAAEFATLDGWLKTCALPVAGDAGAGDGGVSGNVLIADQYNNRVIEVTRHGDIVWSFGDGASTPGPTSVVAPNDAERLPGGQTLIAGTGTGAGTEPACPADGGGCPDNRVLIVDDATKAIVWQYGPAELSSPVAAALVPTTTGPHVLITDQGNARVIEVDQASKQITWQFPPAGDASAAQALNNPNSAERLANGNTLIADEGGNRVIEVKTDGSIVWQYPQTIDPTVLSGPAFASRLPTGNTLITDSNNNRIVEVTGAMPAQVVLNYSTAARNPANSTPLPTRAVRLANGDTLISDQFNHQVIEIDATPQHAIVYTYGTLGTPGSGPNQLDGPYDAKVVGDYTGLTPPQ
jgi:hypothetical protein